MITENNSSKSDAGSIDPENPAIAYDCYPTLPSTHQWALRQSKLPIAPNHLKVIVAHTQTHGVGSHQRSWLSGTHDFHINLIFNAHQILPFAQLAAYTVCTFLEQEIPQAVCLKWPNDVCVGGAKISGCLATVRGHWVTIGVGINYNLEAFKTIDQPATSVRQLLNQNSLFSQTAIFAKIQRFSRLFMSHWLSYSNQPTALSDACSSYWLYLHQNVTIFDEDQQQWLNGLFQAVLPNGSLQLKLDSGHTTTILNGTHLQLAKD